MGLRVTMESVAGLPLNTLLSVAQARDRGFSEALILYGSAEVAVALACVHARMDDASFAIGIVNPVATEPGAAPRRRTLTKPLTA
ncbi:hypothetical protein K8640_36475 [Myxococcus sp. XM-1-1-1]|uniref:hypothetical protein n=1 Tax=Myxococcus sp. XM-1-1-1 TaxID=2874602 RepID=UPI001CC13371|nr:hypothetical protein [Myxococcus sp. XM-1-1-1]MBZ4413737.1 hypothetical protein [Myxococcus sp. XM-1-1-1]BDT37361.1 hypothetical protein MFMH1_70300 [Myxococcus sp. MH1]